MHRQLNIKRGSVYALCLGLFLTVSCGEKAAKKDLVEQNLDLIEEVARVLEADRPLQDTLEALEALEVTTRERRLAVRGSLRALDPSARRKLENDHRDRLNDLTHRIAVAKGSLIERARSEPEHYRRLERISRRF